MYRLPCLNTATKAVRDRRHCSGGNDELTDDYSMVKYTVCP